jgi:hypothetical protein
MIYDIFMTVDKLATPGAAMSSSSAELPGLLGETTNPYPIPEAMLAAAPSQGEQKRAYMIGALAATIRRANPIDVPEPFEFSMAIPPDGASLYDGPIHIQDLPYLASPIVELIRAEMPDLVIAADRGGRLLGLAVFEAWRRRYPHSSFPTLDGKLHFGRISKRLNRDAGRMALDHMLNRSGLMAEMAQRHEEKDRRPLKVTLLDDWVNEGVTVDQVREYLEDKMAPYGGTLQYSVGTMRGTQLSRYSHAVGDTRREHGKGPWTDDSVAIGVDYDEGSMGVRPQVVRSEQSRDLRHRLVNAINKEIQPSYHTIPSHTATRHRTRFTWWGRR